MEISKGHLAPSKVFMVSLLYLVFLFPPKAEAINNDDFRNAVMGTTSVVAFSLLGVLMYSAVKHSYKEELHSRAKQERLSKNELQDVLLDPDWIPEYSSCTLWK